VLSTVKAAQKSIRVAAYSFTSQPIAAALVDARKRGVDVRVVADAKSNTGKYTAVTYLANQGVPARLNDRYAIHHHKFMVVDGQTLQTGSFNYSKSAEEKNAENVLVLYNVPELAGQYAAEWERLWDEGRDVGKKY
jgi:phosphatidylserine/phosphatidylglycerophosphate/cardiolipin synthase-like enzyme